MISDVEPRFQWRFRPARPDDEPRLLALFEESFGRAVTPEHWRWKYRRAGDAVAESWVGVDPDDRPVFHYGGMRCDVVIDDRITPAVVAVDSFTATGLRRRGLLTQGARDIEQRWHDTGVKIVFGLPNEQWGSRALELFGSVIIELRWWMRILRPVSAIKRRIGRVLRPRSPRQGRCDPSLAYPSKNRDLPSDADISALIARSRGESRFRMAADRQRWQWRFADSPMWRYEIIEHRRHDRLEGLAAVRLLDGHHTAVVSALEVADLSSARELLGATTRDLKARGFDTIRALAPTGSPLENTLRSSGFVPARGRFRLHIKALDASVPQHELDQAGLWWLSAGDFDVG